MRDIPQDIATRMVERYSRRYRDLGYHVRTLGWGSLGQQRYRFEQALAFGLDLTGAEVVDFGCGFGDYYDFLREAGVPLKSYLGLDINPDLLTEARQRHADDPQVAFAPLDLTREPAGGPVGDVGVMLGVLNLNLGDAYDNEAYSRQLVSHAFTLVRHALVVDFLSARLCPDYPREDFVYYHEPTRLLDFALSLTPDVALKHDYQPIPQKEFMLLLRKPL